MPAILVKGKDARTIGVATSMVLDLIHRLAGIGLWEPVGTFIERARLSLAGHEGLTAADLARASRWAMRWEELHPKIATFFIENLFVEPEIVSAALWAVLDGTDGPTPGWLHGGVSAAWRRWDGADCDLDIPYRRRR
jgi:hypothetical protein